MTRRVGLAQALINDPDLILLDEPTTDSTPSVRGYERSDPETSTAGQDGSALQSPVADVQDVCDRVAILDQGELKELGRVTDLLKVQDVTEIHTERLKPEVEAEIRAIIEREGGTCTIDNPTPPWKICS